MSTKKANINPLVLVAAKQVRGKLGEPFPGSVRGEKAAKLRDSATAFAYASEHLSYDPESGVFRNRTTRGGRKVIGAISTTSRSNGYLVVSLMGVQYLAHRLAWLLHHGVWPDALIDHINGDVSDNRLCNLRNVSCAVNTQNRRGAQSNNKLGLLGVSYNKGSRKYRASIKANGRHRIIGLYETPEEAHSAYLEAKKEIHKEAAK